MALKKSYSSKFGTSHTQAYHKIDWVSCSTVSIGNMEIRVGIYATAAAKAAGSASLADIHYNLPYTSSVDESFVSQSYEHLKSLDEYSGSADV